jgi:hypothetical protein
MCYKKGVKKERAFDRFKDKFHRLYGQGVDNQRLVSVVNNWVKWAK